jgi:hypothetical protein
MKQFLSIIFFLSTTVFFYSCKKEYSLEGGIVTGGGNTNSGTSEGTLGGTPGTCANVLVKGIYGQGIALNDSTINVSVEVTISKPGTYTIGTDTINGVHFVKSGTFTDSGVQRVTLRAFGTPSNPGLFTYTVKYKGSSCNFEVEVFATAITNGADYFPTTANSYWTYNDDLAADTFRTTSTGSTKDFAGNTYSVFIDTPGIDSAFYRKGSGLYYEYFQSLAIPGATNLPSGEYIFLKDNVPVNSQWESAEFPITISGVVTKLKLKFTIVEKNTSKLIGSKIYANVIVVKRELLAFALLGYQTVDAVELSYAKGIGRINDEGVTLPYTDNIISYKVF